MFIKMCLDLRGYQISVVGILGALLHRLTLLPINLLILQNLHNENKFEEIVIYNMIETSFIYQL